jgi:hypothetical protein
VLGWVVVQQTDGVGQDIDDGFNLLNAPLWRTWRIANDRLTPNANNASRQPTEWVDKTHGLSQTRGFAFNNLPCSLGRLVAWGKPSASGANDDTGKTF